MAMAPRTCPPQTPLPPGYVRVSPEDEAELRETFAALDRGEYVELTDEELQQMAEGESSARLG
jgi:hypothetical protein